MESFDCADFHSRHYVRLNHRRLEHLASLGLDVSGRTVLELGAGIGDLSTFFLDRECAVTSVEVRPENRKRMDENIRAQYAFYPGSRRPARHRIVDLDLDAVERPDLGSFEIAFCYGVLYHLRDPAPVIRLMGSTCEGLCLVETCVSCDPGEIVQAVDEDPRYASQAFHGMGCRPSRAWVFRALAQVFPHVYVPRTQPFHEEFPLDWEERDPAPGRLTRAVFVASRAPLSNAMLLDSLPARQVR